MSESSGSNHGLALITVRGNTYSCLVFVLSSNSTSMVSSNKSANAETGLLLCDLSFDLVGRIHSSSGVDLFFFFDFGELLAPLLRCALFLHFRYLCAMLATLPVYLGGCGFVLFLLIDIFCCCS